MEGRLGVMLVTALVAAVLGMTASPASATYPGPNGRIAFSRFDPAIGDQDLYTANPDGTHVLQVTHRASYCPEWSPDGRTLAFTFVDPHGVGFVATMSPDGSNKRILHAGECATWSPDGSRIAFDYGAGDPNAVPDFTTSLWVMNADGTHAHPLLSPSSGGFDIEPHWQPTGRLIAFERIRAYLPPDGVQQEAVLVVRPDGTGLRRLTSWGLAPEHASWSPDGSTIVFNDASFKPGAHETIYGMRPDGTDMHVIYQGTADSGGTKPKYSPDGSKILFMCVKYRSAFGNTRFEDICTMDADGTGIVDITNTPDIPENQPAWGSAPLR